MILLIFDYSNDRSWQILRTRSADGGLSIKLHDLVQDA